MKLKTISKAVSRFHTHSKQRGRKKGWRKTSQTEDKCIFQTFQKVRKPLGRLVEAPEVWKKLPARLRKKITPRTVLNRLNKAGYKMQEKLAGEDHGDAWRVRRLTFCHKHKGKTSQRWRQVLQGAGDFRLFPYYPRTMKAKYASKSAPRTMMTKAERRKAAFAKPRRKIFKRTEYKKVQWVKVFGLTTSEGESCICRVPTKPTAEDWIKVVNRRLGPFLAEQFPSRTWKTILLDGESLLHTPDAKAAMRKWRIRCLPDWPPSSPDLNPQENVWGWAKKKLLSVEARADTFEKFRERVADVCHAYPSGAKLIHGMPGRIAKCIARKGANINK